MTARLRAARESDLTAIVAIKESLKLSPERPRGGGFLLGCSPERYAQLIRSANFLLLEEEGEVTGFAVTLPDSVLKGSELWQRRADIRWEPGEGEPPPAERIGYFDQLAVRPCASRRYAAALAFAAARELALDRHAHLYATILDTPVRNEAALPLLRTLGARKVGSIAEDYPEAGAVMSDLYHAPLQAAVAALELTPVGRRTAGATARLAA